MFEFTGSDVWLTALPFLKPMLIGLGAVFLVKRILY